MACSVCHREIRIAARGLCGACYMRWQKRGTTDYAPVRVRGKCTVADCDRPHAARGFCDLHHQRVLTTGNPEATKRPDSWGAKTRHPLYNRWAHMMRHRHQVAEEWRDFLQFAADIGRPPDPKAKIFAADETALIGPDNFVWKMAFTERAEGEDEKTFNARRARAYRHVHKGRDVSYAVKRLYGLSPAQRAEMAARQGGKCAICGMVENVVERRKETTLCVDHCHDTGKVRGLLCSKCNTALGLFRDSPDLLRKAIDYLGGSPPS